ncbi:hypothetical protein Btru_070757 [Bulinus truncatus]|nr:hypothetical protein Btru_070757 [Bulinus truncatus]
MVAQLKMSFSLSEELSYFPCSFNLQVNNSISRKRFQSTKKKLSEELDWDKLTLEEKVRILNLLTWVTFSLGNETEQAVGYNNESLRLTNSSNLTALCNRIFISFEIGDKNKFNEELKCVKCLKEQTNFEVLKAEALAEQAFTYVKLGLVELHSKSRELLSYCTVVCPDNYLWKLDLGLVCEKLTQCNFKFNAGETLSALELMSVCTTQLMMVGERAHPRLRGLAYGELACLRQHNPQPEWDHMFNYLSIPDLCERALVYGSDNPVVLAQCGNCLKGINIDDAIKYIRQSILLRPTSKAYHYLGLCYVKKADMITQGRRPISNPSFGSRSAYDYARQNRFRNPARFNPPNSNQTLKMYAYANLTPLKKDNALVTEAKACYEKAIELSLGENLPARQCLGQLYYKVGQYQDALREFNQIITNLESNNTHIVTLISAHNLAGKSLLKLNKLSRSPNILEKAKEHFIKNISLAAGLARKDPAYKNCTIEVWDAFKKLLKDIEEIQSPKEKNKLRLQLLDMVEYTDMFREIENMLRTGLDISDVQNLQIILNRCLSDGQYEKALAYLNMAMTNDTLWQEVRLNSELLTLQSRIYIGTLWNRLLKGSIDFNILFQQIFDYKYVQNADRDEDITERHLKNKDVLIMHYELSDSKTLAHNLSKVIEVLFGLKTSRYMKQIKSATKETDSVNLLQEMVNYSLTLLILDDSDPESIDETITAVHTIDASKLFIINSRQRQPYPSLMKTYKSLNWTKTPWQQTKLMETPLGGSAPENDTTEFSSTEVLNTLFDGNIETVMRLFCFIVDEEFDNHREHFKP